MTHNTVFLGAALGVLLAIIILIFGITGLLLVTLLGLLGAIAGAQLSGQIDLREIISFKNKN